MPRLSEADLVKLVSRAFEAASMRPDMAKDAAQALVTAEMMGITTHGLSRVSAYVDRLRGGGANPAAVPQITSLSPALRQVDGQNGLGASVAHRATLAGIEAARATGLSAVFCRGSTHLGALAPHLLHAAEAGMAAIFTTNTAPMIAAPGGRAAVLGNQPIGLALPEPDGNHLILDIALSVAARSKVRRAAAAGQAIPDTWATDRHGHPTTDAAAALQGQMQAIGGTKGANVSLALDLMTGILAGSSILSEVPNANLDTAAVPNVGHMFVLIDASLLCPPATAAARLGDARALLEASAAPNPAPRLPGDRALAALRAAKVDGVDLDASLVKELERLASA